MDKTKTFFLTNLFLALFFIAYSVIKLSVYIFDATIYLFFILLFWRYHKRLNQTPFSLSSIFLALLLLNLGTFGYFSSPPFGLPYDKILHFLSGIGLTYMFFLLLRKKLSFKTVLFIAVLCSLGLGALGELNEFAGWQLFPPRTSFEGGLLDPGVGKFLGDKCYLGDIYLDTIGDMASNLAGAVLSVILISSARFLKGKRKK